MKWLSTALTAVALSWGLAGQAIGQSADVALTKRVESGVVEATFVLSKPTKRLRFPGEMAGTLRRLTWRLGDSATLSGDGKTIHFAQPVRRFTAELRPEVADGQFDRVYTPLVPLNGGRAVAVYADYLVPRDGGVVRIAGEGIASGRRATSRQPAWVANDDPTYLVVGPAGLTSSDAFTMTVDAQMPSWVAAALPGTVKAIMDAYGTKFASRPSEKIWIVASHEPTDRSGQPSFRGDVSRHMIRLNLMGSQWRQPDPELIHQLNTFVAHELAHLWNNGLWQTAANQPVWLHEGGAEAVARDVLRTISGDQARYAAATTEALMDCFSANGDTLQAKTSQGGQTHYACGVALFHMASSLAAKGQGPGRPLDLLSAVFDRQRGTKVYAVDDLVEVVRQAGPYEDALKDLAQLIASNETWANAIGRSGSHFGLRAPGAKELGQPAFASRLLDNLFDTLMARDCGGATNLYRENHEYTYYGMPQCQRLKESLTITALEGIHMRSDPRASVQQAMTRCAAGQDLRLSTAEGKEFALPCAWTPPPVPVDGG